MARASCPSIERILIVGFREPAGGPRVGAEVEVGFDQLELAHEPAAFVRRKQVHSRVERLPRKPGDDSRRVPPCPCVLGSRFPGPRSPFEDERMRNGMAEPAVEEDEGSLARNANAL